MKWRLGIVALVFLAAVLLPMQPASTWVSQADPSDQSAQTTDPLADTRRAASDAASQLSLLTTGTGQLVNGVGELDEGKGLLVDAIAQARGGAQELSNGMVQLQAGTGQLGAGATQLADSVGEIVAQVAGFEAVRGQVVAAIDRNLEATKDSKDPDVVASRESLQELRHQAATAEIPADAVEKMNQLRDGSRDLANQLAVPGYAYHDGIYTATNGAASLASGLAELEGQVQEASGGISQLVDGTEKINTLAQQSSAKMRDVRASLPPAVAGASAGAVGVGFSPIAAMLLAALAVFGGLALGAAGWFAASVGRGRAWVLGLGTVFVAAAGVALAWIVGTNLGAVALAGIGGALALGVLASAGLTQVFAGVFGARAGLGLAGVLAVVQTGLVGWVWRQAASAPLEGVWESVSQVFPMHWITAAVTTAGNAGDYRVIVSAALLCMMVAAVGLAGVRRPRAL
ncbi:hypothetical protein [Corynebacterium riegelii]|uniref:hypothetical protein n=1 Tax=Corynebacterium riegelii TaxID=156976 RepID=UPI0023F717C7|nr:hypothetical protein [Corynebacterium riegelii]